MGEMAERDCASSGGKPGEASSFNGKESKSCLQIKRATCWAVAFPSPQPGVGWLPGGTVGEGVPSSSSRLNEGVTQACGCVPCPEQWWVHTRRIILVEQMNNIAFD